MPHAVSGHSGAADDPPCIMVLLVVGMIVVLLAMAMAITKMIRSSMIVLKTVLMIMIKR